MSRLITLVLVLLVVVSGVIYINIDKDTDNNNDEDTYKEEALVFTSLKDEYKQGEYIEMVITNVVDNNLKIVTDLADPINNELYYEKDKAYCYIPVSIAKLPGEYSIEIYDGNTLVNSNTVTVVEGEFLVQNLTIDQNIVDSTQTASAYKEYREAVAEARSYNFKERFYEDGFILPAEGRITTEFGVKRYTNGSTTPTRHYGIDIANKAGTPVKATASGRVVFADYLTTSGNYIVIDHGRGLYSYYAHMDSLKSKKMDFVNQGDIIGYIGTTGYSTGPHLHFNLTFKETSVNPWLFIDK